MTDWHPALGTPDPADGWISDKKLAAQREAEETDRRIARRIRFNAALDQLTNPTPEAIANAWAQSDEETR